MNINVQECSLERFNEISSQTNSSFEQSYYWGQFKLSFRKPYYFEISDDKFQRAVVLLFERKIGPVSIGYIPHGIKMIDDKNIPSPISSKFLKALTEKIREDFHFSFILIDPFTNLIDFQNFNNELEGNLKDANFINAGEPELPHYTHVIDLKKTEDELLSDFEYESRRRVRKVEKMNVKYREAQNEDDVKKFWEVLNDVSQNKSITLRNENYYLNLWKFFKPLNMVDLNIVELDNEVVGGYMSIFYNNICFELYGGCKYEARKLNVNYFLKWENIKHAKRCGIEIYDQWGAANETHKNSKYFSLGLFKKSFGGQFVDYLDQYVYIINPLHYQIYKAINSLRRRKFSLL